MSLYSEIISYNNWANEVNFVRDMHGAISKIAKDDKWEHLLNKYQHEGLLSQLSIQKILENTSASQSVNFEDCKFLFLMI